MFTGGIWTISGGFLKVYNVRNSVGLIELDGDGTHVGEPVSNVLCGRSRVTRARPVPPELIIKLFVAWNIATACLRWDGTFWKHS